jgi:hypothetical protein
MTVESLYLSPALTDALNLTRRYPRHAPMQLVM